MDPFKLIVGSTNPKITKILSKLSAEEKKFLSIIEQKSDLTNEIKRVIDCTVIIDADIPWEGVPSLPTHIIKSNRKCRIILVSENGVGPETFLSIIKPTELLDLSKRIISQNKGKD